MTTKTLAAKIAATVFAYEAVALGLGPIIKRRSMVEVQPLSDYAIRHPFGTGVLVGVLAFHLHVHYLSRQAVPFIPISIG